MSTTEKFVYGRIYKAYFFEQPITKPICACVIATSFEEALSLVREQFPDRIISAFHGEDTFKLVDDYSAVIIAPDLPQIEPPPLARDPNGVPEELSRSWFHHPSEHTLRSRREKPRTKSRR